MAAKSSSSAQSPLVLTLCVGTHCLRCSASSSPTQSVGKSGFPCKALEPDNGVLLASSTVFLPLELDLCGSSLLMRLRRSHIHSEMMDPKS